MFNIRKGLKDYENKVVKGTAKYIYKGGRNCLLRNIYVEDDFYFDPDIYLTIEEHLWTNSSIFFEKGVEQQGFCAFEGTVYSYTRKDNSTDYSIKLGKMIEISDVEYFQNQWQQFYCREVCPFFNHCYYNCCAPQQDLDNFVNNQTINSVLSYRSEKIKGFYDDFKSYRKILSKQTVLPIGENYVYLGIYKSDFCNRFKDQYTIKQINDVDFYVLKLPLINNVEATILLSFKLNNTCDTIILETNEHHKKELVDFIENKYNKTISVMPHDADFLNLLKEEENDITTFSFNHSTFSQKYRIIISVPISTFICLTEENTGF